MMTSSISIASREDHGRGARATIKEHIMPTANPSRRQFLSDVGCGVLVASVGATLASDLGLSKSFADTPTADSLTFGALESLVALMQVIPIGKLLPTLTEKLNNGIDLRTLVSAAALATA